MSICNEGWVCEKHPEEAWGHGECEAAGAPCICNPRGRVDWDEVIRRV